MTTRISCANGDFTTAGSWALVDATSLLDSEAGSKALTGSYVESSAFTPGAIEIDGIAIHATLQTAGTATGTISCRLAQGGSTVAGTEVTINSNDINICSLGQNEGGWYLFKFAPVTLAGATAYTVSLKHSTNGPNIFTDSTSGNWSRMLRTTTTGAPAATDILHVLGEHTGAGTGNNIAITMNETVSTDYGAGTDNLPAMTIGKRGTLTYSTAAATYLKLSGDLIVYSGGTLNMIQTDATRAAILEFDPGADGGNGLLCRNGSTVTITGATKTHYHLLNANAAVNATSITCDATPTGWKDNDEIVLASTTRTPAQTEKGTLNGAPAGVTFSIDGFGGAGGGLAYAHDGVSPTQGEVCNITRNVKIRSATSTIMAYVRISPTAVVNFSYAEFYYIGEEAAGKYGITVETTTGSCSITYCSIHDTEDRGVRITTVTGGITLSNNVFYLCNTIKREYVLGVEATSGTHVFNNNVFLGCDTLASNLIFYSLDAGSTYTNNRCVGNATGIGFYLSEAAVLGTFSGNVSHSNGSYGFYLTASGGTISTTTAWRNGSYGLLVAGSGVATINITTITAFGNVTSNISVSTGFVVISSATINSEAGYTTGSGIRVAGGSRTVIISSSFGVTSNHTSYDLLNNSSNTFIYLYNTTLATTTETSIQFYGGVVYSQKHDASATTFKQFQLYGTILSETTTRHTASGYAWKMTPSSATYKMLMPGPTFLESWQAAVAASAQVTIKVWLYKDATYNGNQPRLILVGGYIGDIPTDVVATMTAAHSNWEQLTVQATPNEAGVVMFYVDCDGTAGNVYVDDISVSQTGLPSSNNLDYPVWGLPMQGIYAAGGGVPKILPSIKVGL